MEDNQSEIRGIPETADELFAMEAPYTLPGQQYAVISALARKEDKTTMQFAKFLAMNIFACTDTVDEAKVYIRKLQSSGFDTFALYIVKMNVFFPFPPPKKDTDINYCQEKLTQVFTDHKDEANATAKLIKDRVRMDKETTDVLRKEGKKKRTKEATDSVLAPTDADSVGVEINNKTRLARTRELHAKMDTTQQEALRKDLRDAKSRARATGMSRKSRKYKKATKVISDALEAISNTEAGGKTKNVGMWEGIPTMAEVSNMTPEQKEEARKDIVSRLPKPENTKMRCVMGKPRTTPPPGINPVRIGMKSEPQSK